jgi:Flp pilus assembly protein TadG
MKKFLRDKKGAVSIEFAFCALPFFILFMGIIETAVIFTYSLVLDGAVIDASRTVRTGEAQESVDALDTFETSLCASLYSVISCDKVNFKVKTFSDFTNIEFETLYDEDGNPLPNEFDPGTAGDIVVVRVSYSWNIITPILSSLYGSDPLNLVSTSVFRTEPYAGAI